MVKFRTYLKNAEVKRYVKQYLKSNKDLWPDKFRLGVIHKHHVPSGLYRKEQTNIMYWAYGSNSTGDLSWGNFRYTNPCFNEHYNKLNDEFMTKRTSIDSILTLKGNRTLSAPTSFSEFDPVLDERLSQMKSSFEIMRQYFNIDKYFEDIHKDTRSDLRIIFSPTKRVSYYLSRLYYVDDPEYWIQQHQENYRRRVVQAKERYGVDDIRVKEYTEGIDSIFTLKRNIDDLSKSAIEELKEKYPFHRDGEELKMFL